jgi:LPS-assembly lipoprotein
MMIDQHTSSTDRACGAGESQPPTLGFAESKRATIVALAATALLAACGFQLRGPATLPYDTLYVQAAPTSQFAVQLRRVIGASGHTRVTNKPEEADAILQVLNELREKEILSLTAGGRVSEFQLRYRVFYQVVDKAKTVVLPQREIVLRRDFPFNDQDQISKESEEALLYRDMQADAVQQMLRQLQAATKSLAKAQ